jgi:hypothetical protein
LHYEENSLVDDCVLVSVTGAGACVQHRQRNIVDRRRVVVAAAVGKTDFMGKKSDAENGRFFIAEHQRWKIQAPHKVTMAKLWQSRISERIVCAVAASLFPVFAFASEIENFYACHGAHSSECDGHFTQEEIDFIGEPEDCTVTPAQVVADGVRLSTVAWKNRINRGRNWTMRKAKASLDGVRRLAKFRKWMACGG